MGDEDGDEVGKGFFRCGTQCLYHDGGKANCKCGDTSFGYEDGKWCCPNNGEECDIDGKDEDGWPYIPVPNHVTCKSAKALNLTQQCVNQEKSKRCNYFPEDVDRNYYAARS